MRVAVLGVGLIGGSIGLAARRRAGAYVVGYDKDVRVLSQALELGAIDEPASEIADAVRGADVVFAAVPVGALADVLGKALCAAGPECALSDVGSTKRKIVEAVHDERFVGGHPLAGAETASVEHAREDLFDGAVWYLTPRASANPVAFERLRGLIEQFGARTTTIEVDTHDHVMARVSHLPHVLANVLVAGAVEALIGEDGTSDDTALVSGPSFRDATRVAGANTAIWTDIYLSNRDALIEALDEAVDRLEAVRDLLVSGDSAGLASWNERALTGRRKLLRARLAPGS